MPRKDRLTLTGMLPLRLWVTKRKRKAFENVSNWNLKVDPLTSFRACTFQSFDKVLVWQKLYSFELFFSIFQKKRIDNRQEFRIFPCLIACLSKLILQSFKVTSLAIWFLAAVSPYERLDSNISGASSLPNQFTLLNSFWFTVGSLMQQICWKLLIFHSFETFF